MALQAEQIDVAQFQHVGIGSAMCQMAGLTSINLHRLVLEYKGALLVGVAFEANCVLRGGSAHLFGTHRTVHVVAIAALDQPFIHAMMERHVELGFLLEMACVAKFGLGLYQQEIRFVAVVRRMAGDATHVIPRMLRSDGIHVLRAAGMASEAARVDFFRGSGLKLEDFRFVTAAVDVGLAWTMASLTALPLRTLLIIEGGDKVPGGLEVLDETLAWHIFVAGLASLLTDVQRGIGRLRIGVLMGASLGGLR